MRLKTKQVSMEKRSLYNSSLKILSILEMENTKKMKMLELLQADKLNRKTI